MFKLDFNKTVSGAIRLPDGKDAEWDWKRQNGEAEFYISLPYLAAFGMGEKYNALNQKGNTVVNETEEKFCFQGDKTYCPAPFFWTDSGLGIYADTARTTTFAFEPDGVRVTLPLNTGIIVFTGIPERIIAEYMALFGSAKLPPKWAFGPWISANHWDSQAKVHDVLEQLRRHDYPATVLVLEAWSDEATFYLFNGASYTPVPDGGALKYEDFDFSKGAWPDPREMLRTIHGEGLRLVLWQIPVYKKQGNGETPNAQNDLDRADALARSLCVRNADGFAYTIPEGNWFGGSMIPDFTNPTTLDVWFSKRQYLSDIGVDGFKTDGGEFIYNEDAAFADGSSGLEGKNRYAQDYLKSYTNFLKDGQILFSRAGFSGQHTTPIHWAGDQQSVNSELRSALTAGLSAASTGVPFWGFDIGGFAGPLPTLDLYRRATQAACFCPVMQWHSEPAGGQFKEQMPGGEGNNERSPWNLAKVFEQPDFIIEMRFWHNLRMNLMPYLYSTAIDCVEYSRPMMRPLAYDWPQEPDAVSAEDEFLLGESLLVAPILEENASVRTAYLPEGEWYCLFTRRKITGSAYIRTDIAGVFPVFIRSGKGIALNLGKGKELGSPVGNRLDSYQNLHLILAGDVGSYRFRDDLGNDFTVRWNNSKIEMDKTMNCPVTWEIL